jgi:stage IV sporulation protein FB
VLFEPNPTPFDLRWRMLGTNVTVNPSFWILSALLGWGWFQVGQLPLLLTWIVCVFVSILIHEFGHVLMGRLFGSRDQYIVLYSFGGLAIGIRVRQSYQRILVSFAGPAAQFLLLGAVFLVWFFLFRDNEPVEDIPRLGGKSRFLIVLFMLFEINLFWPILNLLPIWPLDGGQIAREFFQMIWREQGVRYSLILSGVVSGVLAVHCLMGERSPLAPYLWMIGGLFMGLFFAMFAISSFQALQFENSRRRPDKSDRLPWED